MSGEAATRKKKRQSILRVRQEVDEAIVFENDNEKTTMRRRVSFQNVKHVKEFDKDVANLLDVTPIRERITDTIDSDGILTPGRAASRASVNSDANTTDLRVFGLDSEAHVDLNVTHRTIVDMAVDTSMEVSQNNENGNTIYEDTFVIFKPPSGKLNKTVNETVNMDISMPGGDKKMRSPARNQQIVHDVTRRTVVDMSIDDKDSTLIGDSDDHPMDISADCTLRMFDPSTPRRVAAKAEESLVDMDISVAPTVDLPASVVPVCGGLDDTLYAIFGNQVSSSNTSTPLRRSARVAADVTPTRKSPGRNNRSPGRSATKSPGKSFNEMYQSVLMEIEEEDDDGGLPRCPPVPETPSKFESTMDALLAIPQSSCPPNVGDSAVEVATPVNPTLTYLAMPECQEKTGDLTQKNVGDSTMSLASPPQVDQTMDMGDRTRNNISMALETPRRDFQAVANQTVTDVIDRSTLKVLRRSSILNSRRPSLDSSQMSMSLAVDSPRHRDIFSITQSVRSSPSVSLIAPADEAQTSANSSQLSCSTLPPISFNPLVSNILYIRNVEEEESERVATLRNQATELLLNKMQEINEKSQAEVAEAFTALENICSEEKLDVYKNMDRRKMNADERELMLAGLRFSELQVLEARAECANQFDRIAKAQSQELQEEIDKIEEMNSQLVNVGQLQDEIAQLEFEMAGVENLTEDDIHRFMAERKEHELLGDKALTKKLEDIHQTLNLLFEQENVGKSKVGKKSSNNCKSRSIKMLSGISD
ncbi:unnamed protein product [Caenorhabditis auriculariae]|uniref:Uncharacterized protein n=1 Tax=Caenorhabditis auriculariae TaxID=2777116 RepID=A0A8S1GXM2_9PELO|nr:unnamed protein product [Caenorhabditis auriculariae]